MMRTSLTLAYSCAIAMVALAGSAVAQDSQDYNVYDAVIRHLFRDGITQFDMKAQVDQIVIRHRTRSEYAWSPEKENWEQVKIRLNALSDDTIAGYEAVRKTEAALKMKFEIPLKYLLLSDSNLREIFSSPNEHQRTPEQWEEFYKLYPKSAGFNSFSRVGFDKTRRNALVYFVNWCGPLCGTGTYVHLENGEKGWVVKQSAGMWIS
ncbi:MAG TPA: hypothetical protein PLK77_01610 [Pyrinomonadaceae bacterium]|nr:hypothetical protein [Pyrinomonadaceae bacterium]